MRIALLTCSFVFSFSFNFKWKNAQKFSVYKRCSRNLNIPLYESGSSSPSGLLAWLLCARDNAKFCRGYRDEIRCSSALPEDTLTAVEQVNSHYGRSQSGEIAKEGSIRGKGESGFWAGLQYLSIKMLQFSTVSQPSLEPLLLLFMNYLVMWND